MTINRDQIIEKIKEERSRQINLPGSEWDMKNTPNDWVAIVSHYVTESVRFKGQSPNRKSFEDSLIKAAAVCVAALENIDIMHTRKDLL